VAQDADVRVALVLLVGKEAALAKDQLGGSAIGGVALKNAPSHFFAVVFHADVAHVKRLLLVLDRLRRAEHVGQVAESQSVVEVSFLRVSISVVGFTPITGMW
jgi:hypothetical protein